MKTLPGMAKYAPADATLSDVPEITPPAPDWIFPIFRGRSGQQSILHPSVALVNLVDSNDTNIR